MLHVGPELLAHTNLNVYLPRLDTAITMAYIQPLANVKRQRRTDATFPRFERVGCQRQSSEAPKKRWESQLDAEGLEERRKQDNRLLFISFLLGKLAKAENLSQDALASGDEKTATRQFARAEQEKKEMEKYLSDCHRSETAVGLSEEPHLLGLVHKYFR